MAECIKLYVSYCTPLQLLNKSKARKTVNALVELISAIIVQGRGKLSTESESFKMTWCDATLNDLFVSSLNTPLFTLFIICLIDNKPLSQIQGVEDGSVDPGPAASGRCSAPDAVAVRSALPHWGSTLSVPVDRESALVSVFTAQMKVLLTFS